MYDTHFFKKFKCVLEVLRSCQIARVRWSKKSTSKRGSRAENILSACGIQESSLLERQGSGNHERDLMKQMKYFGIIAVCAAAFSVLMAQTKPSNPSVPGTIRPAYPIRPACPVTTPQVYPVVTRRACLVTPTRACPMATFPAYPMAIFPACRALTQPCGHPNPALPIGPMHNAVPSISPIPTTTQGEAVQRPWVRARLGPGRWDSTVLGSTESRPTKMASREALGEYRHDQDRRRGHSNRKCLKRNNFI